MSQYTLFFSWQNDRKDTRSFINAALREAKAALEADGIELVVDQDTRNRTGKRNINAEVLDKIRHCDIFLADLTPVVTYTPAPERHDLPKHMPNSNVMYEYGYALHAKGENRMIVLASLNKDDDEHIEYMPFDINHDTITLFTDVKSLGNLHLWIRNIIKDVDEERAKQVPQYACELLFQTGDGLSLSNEITIRPQYKKIYYQSAKRREMAKAVNYNATAFDALTNSLNAIQALSNKIQEPMAKIMVARPAGKTTNLSMAPVRLIFFNRGTEALDNLEISVLAVDRQVTFDDTNEKYGIPLIQPKSINATSASEFGIFQNITTLNPQSLYRFDEVFIHAPHDIGSFYLQWSLSSRTFPAEGSLLVHVEPDYLPDVVENDKLAGTEQVVDLIKNK